MLLLTITEAILLSTKRLGEELEYEITFVDTENNPEDADVIGKNTIKVICEPVKDVDRKEFKECRW